MRSRRWLGDSEWNFPKWELAGGNGAKRIKDEWATISLEYRYLRRTGAYGRRYFTLRRQAAYMKFRLCQIIKNQGVSRGYNLSRNEWRRRWKHDTDARVA